MIGIIEYMVSWWTELEYCLVLLRVIYEVEIDKVVNAWWVYILIFDLLIKNVNYYNHYKFIININLWYNYILILILNLATIN